MQIDWWTLALQTVNVLVLIWILARFFFRPVMAIVARRQEETNKMLAAAAAARLEADSVRAEADKARAEIGALRDQLIGEARQSAEAEKALLLAQASQEIAKRHEEAEAAVARERAAAEQVIISRASELSVDIAGRLLGRLPPGAALSAFVDELCRELRAMPPEERAGLGAAVEIVTAAPLSAQEQAHVREALNAALGVAPPFTFRADSALIAGIELHSRNTIVRNSWRAGLDRIGEELSNDEHARQS